MSRIDKYYEHLGLSNPKYDYLKKEQNINNSISYMLDRTNIMFKYHNLPDSIPSEELELLLQVNGFAVICKINGDLYAVDAGLGGLQDVYDRATKAEVTVPYLQYNAELTIDTDCVVIKNDTTARGLLPLYSKYCTMLVENDITLILANYQKRIQSYISANNDSTVESAKAFLRELIEGKVGVIAESQLFDSLKISNAGLNTNNGMRDLYEYHTWLKGCLFNEVGLTATNNLKKERVSYAEVELNSDNLYPLVDNMLDNRRKAIKKINEMFGTDIEVELNSSWDYRTYNGKSIHNTDEEIDIDEISETESDLQTKSDSIQDESETGFNESENRENESADGDNVSENGDYESADGDDKSADEEQE